MPDLDPAEYPLWKQQLREAVAEPAAGVAEAGPAPASGAWPEIVAALPVGGMARELAHHSALVSREPGEVVLALDPAHAHLNTAAFAERLRAALGQYYGEAVKLRIETGADDAQTPAALAAQRQAERLDQARDAIDSDPFVNALRDTFDARVDEASIRPPERDE